MAEESGLRSSTLMTFSGSNKQTKSASWKQKAKKIKIVGWSVAVMGMEITDGCRFDGRCGGHGKRGVENGKEKECGKREKLKAK